MKKPEGLRRLLMATVPGLAAAPERLQLYVDKGRVVARAGGTLSFEYRYLLNVVVTDYAGDVTAIVVPVLAWIAEQQPDLLEAGDREPFEFEAEIMDADAADVRIGIELSEGVRITPRAGGGYDVAHVPEPVADADRFPGVAANLWQVFLQDDLIVQSAAMP